MTMADGGDEDGTVVWELGEGAIYDGPMFEGKVLLTFDGNTIRDGNGVTTCTVVAPYLNSNIREVMASNGGPVLFTVWRNFVFEGEVDFSSSSVSVLREQALFEYASDGIYLGNAKDDFLLMTADTALGGQTKRMKLLMAALVTGECGSPGLPGYF